MDGIDWTPVYDNPCYPFSNPDDPRTMMSHIDQHTVTPPHSAFIQPQMAPCDNQQIFMTSQSNQMGYPHQYDTMRPPHTFMAAARHVTQPQPMRSIDTSSEARKAVSGMYELLMQVHVKCRPIQSKESH